MPRVLICDKLESSGTELLQHAGLEVDNRPGLTGTQLQQALQAADAAIVRSQTRITAQLLDQPGKLRAIARAGVGVDNIDVAAATRRGIVVMNTPGGNTISAAEHTIALLFALARHVPAADGSVKAGKWERGKFVGTQLAGKTIGIIGLGRIGREVARRAAGLDMKVVGYDPFLTPERAAELGFEAVAKVEELFPRCDFLTVHVPLTDETKSLIGEKELKLLKPGCRLLNVARGGVINEAALAAALKSGQVAGAALDVFSAEPLPADSPLLQAPNVVLTPHLGASTVEAQENVAREAALLLIDFLTKGIVSCAVNMAAVDRAELEEVRQYIDLAHRLGLLQAQMAESAINRVEITYRGDVTKKGTSLITQAFVAGLLEKRLAESVNLVNAEMLARERGIEVVATSSPKKGDFSTLIQTDVSTEKRKNTASGTLFGNQYLRLVQVGPFRLDTYLDGTMLIFPHRDVPGLIGHIGTIFGRHHVNIARMAMGRESPGGEAIAVLNLDNEPSPAALTQVKGHPAIHSLTVVKLPSAGEMPAWLG
ncbi:MAG TPA: phosphoglycerate dehydrogenase [Gemmataceae bacterium]|nr:phosphoglycerate dehydrogenase [Gemmataceae bacterium]